MDEGSKLYCKCGERIENENIEFINKENEEGENYFEVTANCQCGKEYETTGWGECEDIDEAIEFLIENIEDYD